MKKLILLWSTRNSRKAAQHSVYDVPQYGSQDRDVVVYNNQPASLPVPLGQPSQQNNTLQNDDSQVGGGDDDEDDNGNDGDDGDTTAHIKLSKRIFLNSIFRIPLT